jgi:hypothetical protein
MRDLVATMASLNDAILQLRCDRAQQSQDMRDLRIGLESTLDHFDFRIKTIDVDQTHVRNATETSHARLERVEDNIQTVLDTQEAMAQLLIKLQGTEQDRDDPEETPLPRRNREPEDPIAPRSAFSASELTRGSNRPPPSAAASSPYRFELNSAAKHRAARSTLDPSTATGPQIQALQAQAALE